MAILHLITYLKNCFVLIVPILIWNYLFMSRLPDLYQPESWDNVSLFIRVSENLLRLIVFILPVFMSLSVKLKIQQIGLVMYLIGVFVYFFAWAAQVTFSDSSWSTSLAGHLAPAYTALIWLTGIGLIGQRSQFIEFRRISGIYLIASILFTLVHTWHAYVVYNQSIT